MTRRGSTDHERTRIVTLCAPEERACSTGSTTRAASPPRCCNPRVYLFAFVYFSLTCASLTLNFWMPLMIRDFGITDVVQVSLIYGHSQCDRRGGPHSYRPAFGSSARATKALRLLHDRRRYCARGVDASLESFPAMLAILSAAARADFCCASDFLGGAARAIWQAMPQREESRSSAVSASRAAS